MYYDHRKTIFKKLSLKNFSVQRLKIFTATIPEKITINTKAKTAQTKTAKKKEKNI